ncbi:MAG: hypothetical protein ACWGHH_06625 [Sulfurovaceae bacterium]
MTNNITIADHFLLVSDDRKYNAWVLLSQDHLNLATDISIDEARPKGYVDYYEALEFYDKLYDHIYLIINSIARTVIEVAQ